MKKYYLGIPFITLIVILGIISSLFTPEACHAEEGQTATKKVRVSLDYINVSDQEVRLMAKVRTKVERSYVPVEGIECKFYFNETEEIGTCFSNDKGEALLSISQDKVLGDSSDILYFSVKAIANKIYKGKSKDIEILKSRLNIKCSIEDSLMYVKAWLKQPDSTGVYQGVEGVLVSLYCKRLFGLLSVNQADNTTDEDGFVELRFPSDIPGDSNGALDILVKIEDHDEFGTLISEQNVNWGKKLSLQEAESRQLWASKANAPIALIIIINGMVLAIWSIIGYIIYNLFKIRRLSNE